MSQGDIIGWTIGAGSTLAVVGLAFWGVRGAFRQACVGLSPEQIESLQLAQVMAGCPLQKRVLGLHLRLPLQVWLCLWPLAITTGLLSLSIAAAYNQQLWDIFAAFLPQLFTTAVGDPLESSIPARAGLLALVLYVYVRLPSTIAGQLEDDPIVQRQRRLAGVIAIYRHVRSQFISELGFNGQREDVITKLAEDICENWFPENARYATERTQAFNWLAKNNKLEESENIHRTVFGAMEMRGMPYVVSELRSQLKSARKEVRRVADCELVLKDEGKDKGSHEFMVRANELGCAKWNEVASFRLSPSDTELVAGRTYVLVKVCKRKLRSPAAVGVLTRESGTVLRLNRPSADVARAVLAGMN